MTENIDEMLGIEPPRDSPAPVAIPGVDTSHPLYGVHGWLQFAVVMNLYVAPIFFVLTQIVAWIGYTLLAKKYPGIIVVGLFGVVTSGYVVIRGMQVARELRDLRPRAVQNAKALVKLSLGLALVSIPVSFLSGLDADALGPGIVKTVLGGGVGFTIQYSYLSVSKRVRATYPDWKD